MLLDPKETEAWFAALPMANVGETARQGTGKSSPSPSNTRRLR